MTDKLRRQAEALARAMFVCDLIGADSAAKDLL